MNAIRHVVPADLPALQGVIDSSELFPSEMLPGMLEGYFAGGDCQDIWLTVEGDAGPVGVLYCAPERMTEGTWNMYLIAVRKEVQGRGIGGALTGHVEDLLRARGVRVLLVETSGLAEFELTRKFYDGLGYTREAVIRDFYAAGEDKVVFWKAL